MFLFGRSGSKVMERVKTEGSTSGRVSPASEASLDQAVSDSSHHNAESTEEGSVHKKNQTNYITSI